MVHISCSQRQCCAHHPHPYGAARAWQQQQQQQVGAMVSGGSRTRRIGPRCRPAISCSKLWMRRPTWYSLVRAPQSFRSPSPCQRPLGTSQSDVWKYCPIDNCTNEAEVTARKPWNQSEDARGSTDCFTPWCGPCKLIEPALGRLAMDDNLCKQCTFVKVLSRPIDRDQAS